MTETTQIPNEFCSLHSSAQISRSGSSKGCFPSNNRPFHPWGGKHDSYEPVPLSTSFFPVIVQPTVIQKPPWPPPPAPFRQRKYQNSDSLSSDSIFFLPSEMGKRTQFHPPPIHCKRKTLTFPSLLFGTFLLLSSLNDGSTRFFTPQKP